jgi:hypothetical protein
MTFAHWVNSCGSSKLTGNIPLIFRFTRFRQIRGLQTKLATKDLGLLSILTPLSRCQNANQFPTVLRQPAHGSFVASRKRTQRQRVYPGSESSLRNLPAKNTAVRTNKVTLRHGRAKVAGGRFSENRAKIPAHRDLRCFKPQLVRLLARVGDLKITRRWSWTNVLNHDLHCSMNNQDITETSLSTRCSSVAHYPLRWMVRQ